MRNKKVVRVWMCLMMGIMAMLSLKARGAAAEDVPLSVSMDTAVMSDYVWRGFLLDDDMVIQPGVSASLYGFSAAFWGRFDIDNEDALTTSNEVDYIFGYEYTAGPAALSFGHTHYDFPEALVSTNEWYAGVGLDLPVGVALTHYWDYSDENCGGGNGSYTELGLSYSMPVIETVSLDLSAAYGINRELFIAGDGSVATIGAALSYAVSPGLSISPSISCAIPCGDLADDADGAQELKAFGGLCVSCSY